jgi:hypothetical protein
MGSIGRQEKAKERHRGYAIPCVHSCSLRGFGFVPCYRKKLCRRLVAHNQIMLSVFTPLFVYLLTAEQYYRQGKWSPLGLRAGYIAAGLCPFIFSFGSRMNPFVWIARIPHERWMMYHQWGARVICKPLRLDRKLTPSVLFSMIHTGTMLRSKWDTITELWHEEAVTSQYFTKDARLANGTVAIVLMAWIIFSSFANFRKL